MKKKEIIEKYGVEAYEKILEINRQWYLKNRDIHRGDRRPRRG